MITRALKELKQYDILTIGYCGLMLPIMEDIILAERAASVPSSLTLQQLMYYATMCGVGLDTVPIPGDAAIDEITNIYMDMGTVAFRLGKCLSCRLLPMTDLKAGD